MASRLPLSNEPKINIIRWPYASKKGGSKTQNGRFPSKMALCLKNVCYEVSLCENCQRQSCKACENDWWRTSPSTWKFGGNWPTPLQNADVQSIFVRSASVVRLSKKSSVNTNRKSTTRFPMSLRWTSYVVPMPSRGLKNANRPFSV